MNLLTSGGNLAVPASDTVSATLSDWAMANVAADTSLTLSFDACAEAATYMDCYWYDGTTYYNNASYFYPSFSLTTEAQHFEYTGTARMALSGVPYLRFRTNSTVHGSKSGGAAATVSNLTLSVDW